jgi:flagellar hook-associated protein 2
MTTRISGLGSGMDIDSMIKSLMTAEKIPLNKMNQNKTTASWQTALYREINTKMAAFRTSLDNLRLSGDWNATKVTSSNPTAVSVTASGSATPLNHSVEVLALASSATKTSSGSISPALQGSMAVPNLTIDSTNNQFNVTFNGVKKTITLGSSTSYTAATLQSEVNTKLDAAFGSGNVNVTLGTGTVNSAAASSGKIVLEAVSGNNGLTNLGFTDQQSNRIDPSTFVPDSAGGNLVINGTTIPYSATDTLSTIISKVNSSAAGVTMAYDQVKDQITFNSKTTGTSSKVDLTGTTSTLLANLHLDSNVAYGTDAHVKIDGAESFYNTNSFTLDGATYTLNQTTTAPVNVNVSKDTDAMFKKIQDFVTAYNDTIGLLSTRVNEVKDRNYTPLTDDQKTAMKDADITLWETKAKVGLLHNDTISKKAISSLRLITSQSVTNAGSSYSALYQIGVSTTTYNSQAPNDAGKLVIDETKLRAALATDPNNVVAMFSNQVVDPNNTLSAQAKYDQTGIAQRMYDQVNSSIQELISKAGSTGGAEDDRNTDLGYKIKGYEDQITAFQATLTKKEDAYYVKFGAMDTAIQKSTSQIAWLQQQFK